jgi:L-alanine-DL-glutamate epimerase-like enolase superfamily enzyme
MRIVRLEVIPIALPFGERYRTASGELSAREMAVIKLHTDVGQWGLGEAVPLGLRGGPGLGQIASELAACGAALADADASEVLTRNPVEIRNWIWSLLERCRRQHVAAPVIAALDIALHDLAGRLAGLPMWRLLASSGIRAIHCNATLDAGDPGHVGAIAARQRSAGFATFKVKVGTGEDEARVAAVRRAVGQGSRIRLDANGAWSPIEALEMLGRLDPYLIELVEQPCAGVHELALVRSQTAIPIVADESLTSVEDARALLLARACDAATIKLAKVGGPLEALRIAAILPSYLSSALDGPIGIAAALHTAQALPHGGYAEGFAHGLATLGLFSALYGDPRGLLGPELTPPHATGLGIDVDDAALRELRL